MNPKEEAAVRWFGYGRWEAPYWFVGKEPGGADEPEQYASWLRLGGNELIDCREHDADCADSPSDMLWHGERARLQRTWRPLIALLLAYQGAPDYIAEDVRRYQDERWGSVTGDTAVIELSAVAARSTAAEEALRLTHLPERIATIRARIAEHRPKFVVFYGTSQPYLGHWGKIAGATLVPNEVVLQDGVAYVATPHPTAHGITTAFWTDLGRRLASYTGRSD